MWRATRLVRPLGIALTSAQVALLVRQHWRTIPRDQRRRLGELLIHSKGMPSHLSTPERAEVRELVRGLKLPRLARRTVMLVALSRKTGEDD